MKRIVTCAALLCLIIALSTASLVMLRRANERLYLLIDDCLQTQAAGGDTERCVDALEDYWGEYYERVSFLTRSSTLEEISYSVARLEPLLKEDSDEFLSELNSIRFWARLVYESQIPYISSVF